MKNILESPEVMGAYATIDASYYLLKDLLKELQVKRSPIEVMVDDATGYGADKLAKQKKEATELLKTVIENKKIIEADYSDDEKALNQIREL